jgi:hypothetical protein
LANSNENQQLNQLHTKSIGSSSEEDNDIDDEEEPKTDSSIPDDEKYFVHTDMETNESIQPNNMMDIFRRQPSNTIETNNNKNSDEENVSETSESATCQKPISSSTPERNTHNQALSVAQTDENESRKTLTFVGHDEQLDGEMKNEDDDDGDLSLEDNFSFLIAKGMLRPSSS